MAEQVVRARKAARPGDPDGPLRVLHVINTLAERDGGPVAMVTALHTALNRRPSASSSVVALRRADDELPLHRDGRTEPDRLLGPSTLRTAVRNASVVVIHGHYLPWVPAIAMLCRALRTPFVVVPHGSLTARQQQYSRTRKAVFDALAARVVHAFSRGFVVCSTDERRDIQGRFPRTPVVVGRIGVDLPTSRPLERPAGRPAVLLSLSRLAPKKRVDVSIAMLSELVQRGVVCRLVVAGDGEPTMRETLAGRAEEAGVAAAVDFVGWVSGDAKTRLLAMADIVVLPSEDENFGIAPIEAMAHGVPVVVTRAVASSEFVGPRSGIVLDHPDPKAFADAVTDLLARPDFPAMRGHAHDDVAASLSWETVAGQWEQLLRARVASTEFSW